MALAEISALLGSTKAAIDIAKGIQALNAKVEKNENISKLLGVLISVQLNALDVQSKAHELEIEKYELVQKIKEFENWTVIEASYELKEIAPGVFVYAYKKIAESKEPMHWLCPNCFSVRKKALLQNVGKFYNGTEYSCLACNSKIIDTCNKAESSGICSGGRSVISKGFPFDL